MKKIMVLKYDDAEYPENLKRIKSPPKQLYVMGSIELLKEKSIAIIGSRNCTEKGAKKAQEFSEFLSDAGLIIISGMARGIDSFAHIGALNVHGKTIAVLGAGFKHIFPPENKELFYKIINSGGTVITEYEENVDTMPRQFVERNRIVSGLSEAVFIVEAKTKSGTSITAEFARRQQKKIFCLAHGVDEKEGIGTNRLIKNGAKLVTCPEDILEDLKINLKTVKKNIGKNDTLDVPKEYMPVYKAINEKPINIDEICKKTKMNMSDVNYILTMLELGGFVRQLPGKYFTR